MNERFILLSGCSGGGKSTLLQALSARGLATVPEPGRRIVTDELSKGGTALPWSDLRAFAVRAVEMAKADLEVARCRDGTVFFDRGLIDAAVALEFAGGDPILKTLSDTRPYASNVFLAPPWEALFDTDAERRHDFDAAVQEYDRIAEALDRLGYSTVILPRVSVEERVQIVLRGYRAL